jgi:hypothetical protein
VSDLVDDLGFEEVGLQLMSEHGAHGPTPSPKLPPNRDDRHVPMVNLLHQVCSERRRMERSNDPLDPSPDGDVVVWERRSDPIAADDDDIDREAAPPAGHRASDGGSQIPARQREFAAAGLRQESLIYIGTALVPSRCARPPVEPCYGIRCTAFGRGDDQREGVVTAEKDDSSRQGVQR